MSQFNLPGFTDEDDYKRFTYKLYLYTLSVVKDENIWSERDAKALAEDVTANIMEAYIKRINNGGELIVNKFAYLCKSVRNELKKPDYAFYNGVRRHSVMINIPDNPFESLGRLDDGLVLVEVPSNHGFGDINMHYDFIFGTTQLTTLEQQVSELLKKQYTGKEIAEELGISETSVSRIRATIRIKLGK